MPLEFGSSVHSLCAAQHDSFGIAKQAVQLTPLAAREQAALALAQQLFGAFLFLFRQPILWPKRVKLFADSMPPPLAGADDYSVCLATALDDASSQKNSYTKPSPYFCAGVRNLTAVVPLLNSPVIV